MKEKIFIKVAIHGCYSLLKINRVVETSYSSVRNFNKHS